MCFTDEEIEIQSSWLCWLVIMQPVRAVSVTELVCSRVRIRGSFFWFQIPCFSGPLCKPPGPTPLAADFFSMPPLMFLVQNHVGLLQIKYQEARTDEQEGNEAADAQRNGIEMHFFLAEFWANWPLSVLPFPVSFQSPWKPQINVAYVDSCFYCY